MLQTNRSTLASMLFARGAVPASAIRSSIPSRQFGRIVKFVENSIRNRRELVLLPETRGLLAKNPAFTYCLLLQLFPRAFSFEHASKKVLVKMLFDPHTITEKEIFDILSSHLMNFPCKMPGGMCRDLLGSGKAKNAYSGNVPIFKGIDHILGRKGLLARTAVEVRNAKAESTYEEMLVKEMFEKIRRGEKLDLESYLGNGEISYRQRNKILALSFELFHALFDISLEEKFNYDDDAILASRH